VEKKKILAWCDAPTIKTGFGVVADNLLCELHNHFDLSIVGINYFGMERYDTSKWYIYPVQQQDPFGTEILKRALQELQPDLIFLFQDIFHISQVIPGVKKLSPQAKIVSYFPVDGGPLCPEWANIFEIIDKNITYTQYAIDTIHESMPQVDVSVVDYLYHGVDPTYRILPRQRKRHSRAKYKWTDKFVAIAINRFQPRKNVPALLRAWSMFSKGYKVCKCGNAYPKHLHFCDANRCDARNVVDQTEGHEDVVLYMHMRPFERSNGPGRSNLLPNYAMLAGFTDNDMRSGKIMIQDRDIYQKPYTTEEMNEIYNAADLNVSTAVGEGVGLSLIEAAATGTTTIAPRNSAIPEMLEGHGILIDNIANGMYTQPFDNGFRRPNVNTFEYAKALEDYYQKWVENGKKKITNSAAIEAVQTKFLWQDKRDYLTKVFQDLLK
jgi:glycosyltransferase involved in cell wall biosynthesis